MVSQVHKDAVLSALLSGPKTKEQIRRETGLAPPVVFFACIELRDSEPPLIRRNGDEWEKIEP